MDAIRSRTVNQHGNRDLHLIHIIPYKELVETLRFLLVLSTHNSIRGLTPHIVVVPIRKHHITRKTGMQRVDRIIPSVHYNCTELPIMNRYPYLNHFSSGRYTSFVVVNTTLHCRYSGSLVVSEVSNGEHEGRSS